MADSSVPITAGSGTNIDTFTQAGGDHRQAVVLGDPVSPQVAQVFPGGELRVQAEALQLFYDAYDTALDTAIRWNAPVTGNSGVAAAVASSQLSLATGTVASGYSYLTSQPTFRSSTPGWIRFAFNIALPDGAAPTANSYRYWGAAAPQAVPTTANPISNGAGFEVATTGKMHAVVYNAASRTSVQDLSASGTSVQPLDANPHNYAIYYRPTNIYWYIDSVLVATATLAQSALAADAMPACYMAVGFSTPPSPSAVFNSNAASVSDTTAGNHTISDPVYGWRRAGVGKAGGLAVKSAMLAPVSVNVPAANNSTVCGPADVSEAGAITVIAKNQAAGTAWAGAPVLVFEQSDDSTSWAPMAFVRADTGYAAATHTLPANAANAEYVFDAPCEAVSWARVRITTGPATNPMTVVLAAGGHAFSPVVTAVAAPAAGSALSNVAGAISSTTLLAANANRKQACVTNDSAANLYLGLTGGTVSVTSYTVKIPASGYYELPAPYIGQINGIWDAAVGSARITELT